MTTFSSGQQEHSRGVTTATSRPHLPTANRWANSPHEHRSQEQPPLLDRAHLAVISALIVIALLTTGPVHVWAVLAIVAAVIIPLVNAINRLTGRP